MSDELLPCPFCGGTDIVVDRYEHHEGEWRYRVVCTGCMAMVDSGFWQFKGHAVEAWNRRRPNCGVRVEAMHEPDMDR